jgi:hypothetical protein
MAKVQGRITIEVEVEADDVLELLDKIEDRSKDMRPVFRWTKSYLELSRNWNASSDWQII